MEQIVTKEWINNYINDNNHLKVQYMVGRALLALLSRQTYVETKGKNTMFRNGIGFDRCDAYYGTIHAKYFKANGRLENWMVRKWTKITKSGYPKICKYSKQLNEVAVMKRR